MSSIFQPKNKILANVKVKTYTELPNKDGSFNSNINVLGKVIRDLPNIILSQKNTKGKSYYIDDVNVLTKKTKKEIFNLLANNQAMQNAYLVIDKPKAVDKGKECVINSNEKQINAMLNAKEIAKAEKRYKNNKIKKGR